MTQNTIKIYQAPLQGATDFSYRAAFSRVFGGIDKYFIPYVSYGKGREIKKSQLREVFPENNSALPVVPQVLFSDQAELLDLVGILIGYGHAEINLNLGCPYPMATNRGRGAAWLEKPEQLKDLLEVLFSKDLPAKFSIKMRTGMTSDQDAKLIFKVLNDFPLEEIIFHPRTAGQMYSGKANPELFQEAVSLVKHPLVHNGDIQSVSDFEEFKALFPEQNSWMIGRGMLMNPALPSGMKGIEFEKKELRRKMRELHDLLLESYSGRLDGSGHILMKMNQFWTYFCESFENPHKAMKLIKKAGNQNKYNAAVAEIFSNF